MRLDPEVERHLTRGLQDALAKRIEVTGDCSVCHRTLGTGPLSITLLWSGQPADIVTVIPSHAPCSPSKLVRVPAGEVAAAPVASHACLSMVMPNVGPIMLVNRSVDVVAGQIHDGVWSDLPFITAPDGSPTASLEGLSLLDPVSTPLPPDAGLHWGASMDRSRGTLTVTAPVDGSYTSAAPPPVLDAVQQTGRVLTLVTEDARVSDIYARQDIRPMMSAIAAGQVHGAWAVLGAQPSDVPWPDLGGPHAEASPAGGTRITGTALMREVETNRAVEVRAAFSDHPALQLTTSADRQPVLLLEPHRIVALEGPGGSVQDVRVEAAIGQGLERMPALSPSLPLNPSRDWAVHATSTSGQAQVQLAAPYDTLVAEGTLRFPPGWAAAANQAGQVIVLYGPMIGVRSPRGRSYGDQDRFEELVAHRHAGMVAWGVIPWAQG